MPLVTIIIPVYNTEKYLKRCLDSAIHQTYQNIEIIAINDASTDHSSEILKIYEKQYKNIKVILNPINLGVGASRNKGLEIANGDYIYFLDSDDEMKENAIETLVELITTYNTPLAEATYKLIRLNKKPNETKQEIMIREIDIEKNKEYLCTQEGAVWNKLYSHSLFEQERFPENLIFEDAAVLYPLLTQAKKSVKTNETLYYYYKRPNSIVTSMRMNPNEKIFDIFSMVKLIEQKCQQLGTYTAYEEVLKELEKEKYLYTLSEINTWFPLGVKNHMILLNYIKQYIEQKFDYNSLLSTKIVKTRMEQRALYRTKIALLNKHLELAETLYPIISYDPLGDAKRIIARYKK